MKHTLIIIFLSLSASLTLAQDTQTPLLDILNAVPDELEIRESLIAFTDFEALVAAREGAITPESWEQFGEDESEGAGLYMATLRGIGYGPSFMQYLFTGGDQWEETIGIDFFSVDRVLYFGFPPTDANIMVGDFDTDAVAEAHTARNYTSEPVGDFTLWCGEVGCENGSQVDPANRNISNPFGGDLGRQKPFIVSDSMIIDSADLSLLLLAEDAVTDKVSSLADNANYMTAVHSVDSDNMLTQALFIHPSQILLDTAPLVMAGETEKIEELMEQAAGLPPYNLVMIADTATDREQVVYVTLVYRSLTDAETAIDVIPSRLESMESFLTQELFSEMLAKRGVTDIVATATLDEETNLAMAVLKFHAPLADNEPDEILGYVASGIVYRQFVQMVFARDTNWMVSG